MNILQLGCFRYLDTHITDYLFSKENKVYVVDANPKAIYSIKVTYEFNNLYTLNVAISSKKEDEISFSPFFYQRAVKRLRMLSFFYRASVCLSGFDRKIK